MDARVATAPVSLPAAWYRDGAVWPRERVAVFGASWQMLGCESDLARAGAWIAGEIAGWRVFVIRGQDGVLRGFHDVCRHRAGPLTTGDAGRCEGPIVCRYHGWSYAWDGRLKGARDFGAAVDFDPRELALFAVKVENWRGLVFVAIGEAPPLKELVAPLDDRLGSADWSALRLAERRTHRIACNWKTYVENYLEGYHVPLVHAGLDAEIDSARYEVRLDGRAAIHEAPPRRADAVYDGLWAWLWPNLGVNVYASGLMIERMSPVGPAETRLDYFFLTPGGAPPSRETIAMSETVTAEDIEIVERVQANLDAGVYDTGRLSPKHEAAVAAFQDWVREALGHVSAT